jgi:choline dehydrogenase-like flavoprotein
MSKVTIVGSGPAAAAAALVLTRGGRCEVEILDIGQQLESERNELLDEIRDTRPSEWPERARRELSTHPVAQPNGELPQKSIFGSDFPFRDAGQLEALTVEQGGNMRAISGAFGGFSNAWGAQVMPFSRPTLEAWPIGYDAMVPHYKAILEHIPFAGADDDYSEWFPLLASAEPLPTLAPPAAAALARYAARRTLVRGRGVTMGVARLALDSARCVECGLCLTGCPYGLIYSASQTLQPLVEKRVVSYRDGVLVIRVGEDEQGCWVDARDLRTGSVERLRTDRILLACGGLGTTRIVLNSLERERAGATLKEAVQFVVPFVSARGHRDPRTYSTFTLNQFNMLVEYGRPGLDLAQIHLYPYNPAFEEAVPAPLSRSQATRTAVLRRVTAGLGYLPSWASPAVEVKAERATGDGLPAIHLSAASNTSTRGALLRVIAKMCAVAPALDLWPVLPSLRLSGPAKSYHFGGSFPHVERAAREGALETDALGRPAEWERVHLIDASVFPTVAATTFTLTVMANAHRIASRLAEAAS